MKKKIGEGITAEIYLWNEKEIIKLFHDSIHESLIEKEFLVSQEIQNLGLPVPKVGNKVSYQNRTGIIYEKIDGVTLTEQLAKDPMNVGKEAKRFAELHFHIHSVESSTLSDTRKILISHVNRCNRFTLEQKEKIAAYMSTLPMDQAVCHMDFHPDNILMSEQGPIVIDWMTTGYGNPFADVARTVIILKYAYLPASISESVKQGIIRLRHAFCEEYVKEYLTLSKGTWKDIESWFLPIMAARLIEGIPQGEKDDLYKQVLSLI
ncbi:aminoglycoside phosphotransferase family protein [Bacillus sp. S13(2024)]|uniref:phosphotransferase family protein n=1 Tax=unclassified Bacillus (in: firmicutes) TaxID=185979 RepID=UPI003D1F93B7